MICGSVPGVNFGRAGMFGANKVGWGRIEVVMQGTWRWVCLSLLVLAGVNPRAQADTSLASDNFTLAVGTNLSTITSTESSGVGTYTVIQGTPTTALSVTNISALGFGVGNSLRWPGGGQTYYRAFNSGATVKLNSLATGETLRLAFDARFAGLLNTADNFSFGFVNFGQPSSVAYVNLDLYDAGTGLNSEFRYRTGSFNEGDLGTQINASFTEPAAAVGISYALALEVTRLTNGFQLDYFRDGTRVGTTTGITASVFVTAMGNTNITGVAFRGIPLAVTYIDNLQVVRALPTPSISGVASRSVCDNAASVTLTGLVSAVGPAYPANGETVTVTINGVSQNATIAGGAGAFSVAYSIAGLSPGVYPVTYAYAGNAGMNAAANHTATSLTVVDAGGAAGAITGSNVVSPNQTGVSYSIAPVGGADSYVWTLPAGASITAGAGTPSITVSFGTSDGTVLVAPVTGLCTGNSSSRAVSFSPIDLALVSVTDVPDPVNVGEPFFYTIVVSNVGPDMAVSYYVTNTLGTGVSITNAATDISDGGTFSGGKVSWHLGTLAAGATKTLTLRARAPLGPSIAYSTVTVLPYQSEAQPANNSLTIDTSAVCPGAPAPFLESLSYRVATNGQPITFTVSSTNVDCSTPLLRMAGVSASFPVVTNEASHQVTGTFSWTPAAAGTYPVRFYSWNVGSPTNFVIVQIYVDNAGQPQTGGIWNSQTNWHVAITNLMVPASGNATVVWASAEGITYDLYSSTAPIGGGATWTKVVSGQEADGVLATASVSAAGSMRFYQVVPQGATRQDRGVWGVVRPAISSGIALLSPPLQGDRRFDGTFGAQLAAAVPTGTKVHIMTDPTPNWQTLQRNGSGQWLTSPGGAVYATPLGDGQAFFIEGASGSTPVFSGPVGNDGTAQQAIEVGFNLLGLSEGKGLAVGSAFADATMAPDPVGNSNDQLADQIILQNSDGSWRRLVRLSTGVWYDLTTRANASLTLLPGQAYYYIRRDTDAAVDF